MTQTIRPRLAALVLCALGCGRDGPTLPPGEIEVSLEVVRAGLDFPVDLAAPPGDPDRIFVAEKSGAIRIIRNGVLLARPFLDLAGQVSTGSEQGLLGLAFHPQYAATGRFVVSFTDLSGDTRIVAYQASADPDSADPASADTILAVNQPFTNHNGGAVQFGPDSYLYIALGDGGSADDPQDNGQDRTDLLGSLLRVDIDIGSPYAIPPDNPYAGSASLRQELWNYGLRNPWRFSFDRMTGDLYIADVGQRAWEEVDVAPAGGPGGENYGWRTMEGPACFNPVNCSQAGLTLPVLSYGHGEGCSVTGGYVYRGQAIPGLRGHYFYADFCESWVRSFRYAGGQATERRDWPTLATPQDNITSFGQDGTGELYVLTAGGTVYRIVP